MANRFPGKTCVLCPQPSVGVGEHVIPHWLISDLDSETPFKSENAGRAYRKRNGDVAVQQNLPGTHVPMCSDCNGRLNANIEDLAKPVLRRLVPRSASHTWPTISEKEAAAVAKWLLKVGLFWFHPEAEHDQPQVQRDKKLRRFRDMQPEWLAWMREGSEPPTDFTLFVSRRSLSTAVPWPHRVRQVQLPRQIRVDGRDLRFMSREMGIRGLDATMVWHPGWPIVHPLVSEGRTAVLWPNPSAVDFAALGEAHPGEFRFDMFNLGQETSEDSYRRWTTGHPLAEGLQPIIP